MPVEKRSYESSNGSLPYLFRRLLTMPVNPRLWYFFCMEPEIAVTISMCC